MPENVDKRVLNRANDAPRHPLLRKREVAVNACHDDIQFLQNLHRKIKIPIFTNIHLRTGKHRDAIDFRIQLANLLNLAQQPLPV